MPVLFLIQALALVAGVAYGIPQAVRVVRAHTAAGVSLLAWQLLGAATTSWVVHGVMVGSVPIAIANGVGVAISVMLLWLMIRERRLPALRTCAVPIVLLVLLVLLRVLLGPVPYALAVIVPQLISSSGQLFELIRSRLLTGVSPLFLWFGVVLQALWLTYGSSVHDAALSISAIAGGTLAVANVVWYLVRTYGLVSARPDFLRRTAADEADPPEPVVATNQSAADPVV